METSIEIVDVVKKFGDKRVLEKINLQIAKGEILGLLGPSGAGKTTLIKILTGQLSATEGNAKVLGKNVADYDRMIFTKFGMVLDNVGVYNRMSCLENLTLFAELYGIPKSRALEVLKQVGLEEAKKRPVSDISKGMRIRLVLARALLHEPEILFLDEPTSGLDPATAQDIHKLIREEKKKGKTIFLTTHNMEEAYKLCDNVALLHKGKIVEYGNPAEICREYNHQNKINILLKTGEQVVLENGKSASKEICKYFEEDNVESIHSSEPTLETVFMELTGRGFGDE